VFEYFTKGTILERIDLEVHEMTRKMECVCGAERAVQGPENGYMKCPECGRFAKVEESDYKIEQPDLSEVNPRSKFRC
jgi:Zn finger protein HypA/HybF involved in hydrogenase expression